MRFRDRSDAGRQLASRLLPFRDKDVVVLGLPRGGVAVAAQVARALDAPLDVILVRKLGVPAQPELGMGAIGEGDARVINADVVRYARVSEAAITAVEQAERTELERRIKRFRGDTPREPLTGRTAVLIDDGIATGSTARAACQVARAQGAARVVLAVPVAPPSAGTALEGDADELICLETPDQFHAIGEWYEDFSQTRDEEVVSLLRAARAEHTESGQGEQVTDSVGAGDTSGVPRGGEAGGDAAGREGAGGDGAAAARDSAVSGTTADVTDADAAGAGLASGAAADGAGPAGGGAADGAVADGAAAGEEAPGDGTAGAGLQELVDMMPFAAGLGVVLDAAQPDEVRGRLAWAPERCTTGGLLHGGALMALADSLGGICAYLNLPPGARTATTSSATVFTRAVRDGEVIAVARPLHVGRTVIVVQTDLSDQAGRRVAQVTQTQAVLTGTG
jgi:putative phosphoribosyl transferase